MRGCSVHDEGIALAWLQGNGAITGNRRKKKPSVGPKVSVDRAREPGSPASASFSRP